jgi:thioredoxin reductase (NADPH)
LEHLTLNTNGQGDKKVDSDALLIFIGSKPHTDWVKDLVITDEKGFILTGRDLERNEAYKKEWSKSRKPFLLESSAPGVFAAGDVRHGAMNRVASAVGEGSMAIKFVHEYLSEN